MRLLLDTHTLIWHYEDWPLLSETANQAIDAPGNKLFISVASLWEMAIKSGIGKLTLTDPIRTIMAAYVGIGATILTITPDHALATQNLPWHHRDPFDRLLIAQAVHEGLTLVSRDEVFASYGQLNRMW
ncbi:MAG: type II toxin-antitoxin system VapC family toxin [Candidatus Adiutrix sp.]|jgi:PIN domain nuclease of toxin-antitoxin system|nr:type II toxin-antitoxin system VapC family toxin [Candidatus Adiutrix sp.]